MKNRVLNCGYVPLVDCAPLVIAQELGFAEHEGLTLNLLRQPSWAALRDLLALGHLDAAHMLSPMPVAMSLGLSGSPVEVIAPFVLSANGTVLGVAPELAGLLRQQGWRPSHTEPQRFVSTLAASALAELRVGVPFPYSMHRLLLEYLMSDIGPALAGKIRIITTPPSLMADAVANGELDLFVVGEPWGSIAATSAGAELILPGRSIWEHAPEKVLGLRADWALAHDAELGALLRALYRACAWLSAPHNRLIASELLARSAYLDLPDDMIDPALSGYISPRTGHPPWHVPDFLKFYTQATTFPWRSLGAWIGLQISQLEGLDRDTAIRRAADCLRPDLYRRHLQQAAVDLPGASAKVEGILAHPTPVASTKGEMILGPDAFFDGKIFEFPEIA